MSLHFKGGGGGLLVSVYADVHPILVTSLHSLGLRVYGISNASRAADRTATFAVGFARRHPYSNPDVLTQHLATAEKIYCTSGNHYCTFWADSMGDAHGLDDCNGATRLGFLHYNADAEVEGVLAALERCAGMG